MFLGSLLCGLTGLTVRFAHVDLTPPELLPLGGYTARKGASMEPGGQRLFARAVDLDGTTIVALDMLTVPGGFAKRVRELVGDDHFMLVATHTHCAPDSQMLNPKMTFQIPGIASFSPFWFEWYADRVAWAIQRTRSAVPSMAGAVTLKTGLAKLNHGRRPGAKPDRTTWLAEVDGRPLFASYAAHATIHDETWNKTDGDWPGLLGSRLDAPVLPGPIGDVAPESRGEGPVEKSRKLVENFLVASSRARKFDIAARTGAPRLWRERVALDPPRPHPGFAKAYGVPEALAQILVNRFAEESAYVSFFQLGRLLIVGVPGEPTAGVGRQIQAEAKVSSFPHCLVVSHVDGWIGYILEPDDYDRGGYEGTLSFNGRETSVRLLEAIRRGLKPLLSGRGSARADSSGRRAAS